MLYIWWGHEHGQGKTAYVHWSGRFFAGMFIGSRETKFPRLTTILSWQIALNYLFSQYNTTIIQHFTVHHDCSKTLIWFSKPTEYYSIRPCNGTRTTPVRISKMLQDQEATERDGTLVGWNFTECGRQQLKNWGDDGLKISFVFECPLRFAVKCDCPWRHVRCKPLGSAPMSVECNVVMASCKVQVEKWICFHQCTCFDTIKNLWWDKTLWKVCIIKMLLSFFSMMQKETNVNQKQAWNKGTENCSGALQVWETCAPWTHTPRHEKMYASV